MGSEMPCILPDTHVASVVLFPFAQVVNYAAAAGAGASRVIQIGGTSGARGRRRG